MFKSSREIEIYHLDLTYVIFKLIDGYNSLQTACAPINFESTNCKKSGLSKREKLSVLKSIEVEQVFSLETPLNIHENAL